MMSYNLVYAAQPVIDSYMCWSIFKIHIVIPFGSAPKIWFLYILPFRYTCNGVAFILFTHQIHVNGVDSVISRKYKLGLGL